MGLQRTLCACNGAGSGAARTRGWGSTFASSASPQSSTWFVDAGAGMDYAPTAPKSAGSAARERYGANRVMADARVLAGGGADRPWPDHERGVRRASERGRLTRAEG